MRTGPYILVVDDGPVVCTGVCAFLELMGHEYSSVPSCTIGRELLETNCFSCCIIDQGSTDGHGLGLLSLLAQFNPSCTCIILTNDQHPETIVEAMRAGAFDYLLKPVDFATFQAAIARALHHNDVTRERDDLLARLSRERDALETLVAEATADLRQHTSGMEEVNVRQKVLLELNRVSQESDDEEDLFRRLHDNLNRCVPLQCAALTTVDGQEYIIVAAPSENGTTAVITSEPPASGHLAEKPITGDMLQQAFRTAVESHAGLKTSAWNASIYPQTSLGRVYCAVAFFFPEEYVVDSECDAFLQACASTFTLKWQDLRLFRYAAKRSWVGNLALDLSRDMVQVITAIRTAADVVTETSLTPEAAEGMGIIVDNAEFLRRLLQELRQISSVRKNILETVQLDALVNQAVKLLAGTIEHRGIAVKKDFRFRTKCMLFNGGVLAQTFYDLISSAVRAVQDNHQILLRLCDCGPNEVMFEINYDGSHGELLGGARRATDRLVPAALGNHPKFIMAQRTIRGCGGSLSVEHKMEGWYSFRVVLPKNALNSRREPEEARL